MQITIVCRAHWGDLSCEEDRKRIDAAIENVDSSSDQHSCSTLDEPQVLRKYYSAVFLHIVSKGLVKPHHYDGLYHVALSELKL